MRGGRGSSAALGKSGKAAWRAGLAYLGEERWVSKATGVEDEGVELASRCAVAAEHEQAKTLSPRSGGQHHGRQTIRGKVR